VAVSTTIVPTEKVAVQVLPQLIGLGALATVPLPPPSLFTVTENWRVCWTLNVAVTVVSALRVITQVPVPPHPPPLQPANDDPLAAVPARVTVAPTENAAEQAVPQLMPVGMLVTVPVPPPAFTIVNTAVVRVKVAVTFCEEVSDTVQVPVPVQPLPLQPANVEPLAAVAVKVTLVPLS
jgi:hypothetical protein